MTTNLPKSLTATTGLDALTHAVEAFIGHSTTRKTRKMSIEATKLIVNNLKSYKDQIDNIIIMYYSLLKDVSDTMSKILREKKLENSVN